MNPIESLPRDHYAAKYRSSVTTGGCGFPHDKSDWHADLETAYQQGWEDALEWYKAQQATAVNGSTAK
jgi:hypothetical protein